MQRKEKEEGTGSGRGEMQRKENEEGTGRGRGKMQIELRKR